MALGEQSVANINLYRRIMDRTTKRIIWYVAGVMLIIGLIWLAQYSLTGTVATIGGGVTGVIIYKVREIAADYNYFHPLWFRFVLCMIGIIVPLFGMIVCRELSEVLYESTEGVIGPGRLLIAVFVLMIVLFWWSHRRSRNLEERPARVYSFLMLLSVCLIVAQCGGSMLHSKDMDHQEWKQQMEEIGPSWHESDLVGTWVENKEGIDVMGGKYSKEIFNADGSWQSGDPEGLTKRGKWKIEDNSIVITVMLVGMGSALEVSPEILIYHIKSLSDDKMVVRCSDKDLVKYKYR